MRVGCGFAGGEHAGEVQRGVAVLEVELVHGGGEVGAVVGVGEELGLVLVFGDEVAKGDSRRRTAFDIRGPGGAGPRASAGFRGG